MPRAPRTDVGEEVYHVINRANGRLQIFNTEKDYELFESLLLEAKEMTGMRILAYTIMPNHWHLVLHPKNDGDLSTFMHWLTTTHTRQVHTKTDTIGGGHLYQGRYKSFLVESGTHLLTLIKYVERNAPRAKLTKKCEDWQWGSVWRRTRGTKQQKSLLAPSPEPLPHKYLSWINTPDREDDILDLRQSIKKGVPYGQGIWVESMIKQHNLESTTRGRGRPRKD